MVFPGAPGWKKPAQNKLYGPPKGGAHAKQPRGKGVGAAPEFNRHKPNQSYHAELEEHHGKGVAKVGRSHDVGNINTQSKRRDGGVGHIDSPKGHMSKLAEQDNPNPNHHQPSGKGIGTGMHGNAEHHKGEFSQTGHSFRPPAANKAHGYGHAITERKGVHRLSGHSGAHMIGKRIVRG